MNHSTEVMPQHPLAAVRELIRDTHGLSANERLVLVVIASHSNANGDAWPSAQTIADTVGCSLRTVQRVVARLINMGRLAVRRVAGIASNVYRLVTSSRPAVTSPKAAPTSSGQPVTTSKVTPEVGKFSEGSKGAPRRRWRDYLPSGTKPQKAAPTGWVPRQGAANPPAADAVKCSRHLGELASNCRCCRSEALGGDL